MNLFGTEPIRAELLSVERLEDLAETIARHRVSSDRRPEPGLLSRARENGRVLLRCYRTLAAVINEERASTPTASPISCWASPISRPSRRPSDRSATPC